jgi:hypothetical protein
MIVSERNPDRWIETSVRRPYAHKAVAARMRENAGLPVTVEALAADQLKMCADVVAPSPRDPVIAQAAARVMMQMYYWQRFFSASGSQTAPEPFGFGSDDGRGRNTSRSSRSIITSV